MHLAEQGHHRNQFIYLKTCFFLGIQCDTDPLLEENMLLRKEIENLKAEVHHHKWTAHKIADNDQKTKFYTGLPAFAVFMWLFK